MALPLWGQLEKEQGDNETIEEAINRIVAEHNADSDAHLGSSESLKSHKDESVIDHPEGSVVSDKQTMTEISVSTIFESIDGWSTIGDVSTTNIPGVRIYVESGWEDTGGISTNPQVPKNFTDSNFDMLFQTLLHTDLGASGWDGKFGFFSGGGITPEGFGFIVDDGDLTAYTRRGGTTNESASLSVDLSNDHVFRAFLDAGAQEIKYYVDGTLVATLDVPGVGFSSDIGPNFYIDRGSVSDGTFYIGYLTFSRQI